MHAHAAHILLYAALGCLAGQFGVIALDRWMRPRKRRWSKR